jgi:dUTP pyrophosphatase
MRRFFYICRMPKVRVRIINQSTNPLPEYATEGSAGMDLRASIDAPITLQPLERILIPTGIFIELPEGHEAQVRPRSGLAIKHGLTCLNSPGTVDADYRGELKVILINLSNEAHTIVHGDRIAQMVVAKVEKVKWKTSNKISDTKRGEGGFGHTGKI